MAQGRGYSAISSNGEAVQAFEMWKDAICKAPMPALPGEGGEYVLHSDACKYAVGAVASQKQQDEQTIFIAIWSRKLKSAEMQYPKYNRKLLVICGTVENWHRNLHCIRDSMVYTDLASLRHILTKPRLTA